MKGEGEIEGQREKEKRRGARDLEEVLIVFP